MDLSAWFEKAHLRIGSYDFSLVVLAKLITIVVGVWWLSILIERLFSRISNHYAASGHHQPSVQLAGRIARYTVWVMGTLIGLNSIGVNLSSIALVGGAVGVGLGFGLQNVFSNFISGLIIMIERSLKIGDFVELESGVRGNVREIAMRYTRITTNDLLDILVPNSEFINGRVTNWTLDDATRRMHVPFGVAYGTPKEQVRDAALSAAGSVRGVIRQAGREPAVWLVEYGDSSVNYELVVWVEPPLALVPNAAHAELMWALDTALHAADIEIPFPQRDLHVRSGELAVRLITERSEAGCD